MNGVFVFNKPKGITSHDVVYLFRKKFNIKKVGHTGTLDPIATGVLPICIGKGTKIAQYISSDNKEYLATFQFGFETDTLDVTGKTIKYNDVVPSLEEVVLALKNFQGQIYQKPPMYSALKVNGKKLYEFAREGIEVEIKPRLIEIEKISLIEQMSKETFKILVKCSSGTYIRSLIRDIGHLLNTCATMVELKRTRTGIFNLEDSIDENDLKNLSVKELEKFLIPIDKALYNFESFIYPDEFYDKVINGVFYKTTKLNFENPEMLKLYCKNKFIGIGEYKEDENTMGIKIKKRLIGE
ncbi:tRNA pseudouridine(55) synthase TruB [Anaerosphaera multitolerans]|uniref:tRNA pseudouridine synthase B n=1 Tax=Anaerosphaera multitolerans TaxID=2487351 RepID=A0A437S577_9FIRM|nr:tRNA pseudouridine(55) synthase TruB [Anaerosphaera multitolerans]RVU54171.1 tRNA pseudouridine(55) synthase TruB [Anaerosphaera multitolerans]